MRTFTRLVDANGPIHIDLDAIVAVRSYWPAGGVPSLAMATAMGQQVYCLDSAENCAALNAALGLDRTPGDPATMRQKPPKAAKGQWLSKAAYWAKKTAERKAKAAEAGVDANTGEIHETAPVVQTTAKRGRGRPRRAV